jgi:hypothetical protein
MPKLLRRRFGVALTVLFGASTIAYYALTAGLVNAQPSTAPFEGWVALLQNPENPGDTAPEQLELRAQASIPGAPGDHPSLEYTVLTSVALPTCGSSSMSPSLNRHCRWATDGNRPVVRWLRRPGR